VTAGISASRTLIAFAGYSASNYGQEQDLEIDAAGDLLTIDPGGDVLAIVSSLLNFSGASASILAAGPSEALEAEGWVGLQTEGGLTIETEAT
jgi:hypothetical protein